MSPSDRIHTRTPRVLLCLPTRAGDPVLPYPVLKVLSNWRESLTRILE